MKPGAEDELRAILEEIRGSLPEGSAAGVFERHTADDYVFTSPEGRVSDRSAVMDGLRNGGVTFKSYEISDVDIRVYGSFAVVMGRAEGDGVNPGGEELKGAHRFTSVWSQEGTGWKLRAWQATTIRS